MKIILIALLTCFSFTQGICQKKVNKTTTSQKNNTSINKLIQGSWQSLDDNKNFLMFDKNERKESSDEMKTWDKEEFVLSNKCLNESDNDNGLKPEEDKYISCKQSDQCWHIVAINKDFLTLSYMGRGNTLKYKRVK